MKYEQFVAKVRELLNGADTKSFTTGEHLAFQINVTGEGEGAFYIEYKDGNINVEPYEYYDRDVIFTTTEDVFLKLLEGTDSVAKFVQAGELRIDGPIEKAKKLDAMKPKKIEPTKEVTDKKIEESKPIESNKKVEESKKIQHKKNVQRKYSKKNNMKN